MVVSAVIGVILTLSVFYSGYQYTYWGDEVMHVHMVYLLSSGYTIFKDFFSIHAPIFHYLLLPLFSVTGFTLESFRTLRIFMIVLYSIRLGLGWLLVSKVFSKTAAWMFVVIMLLDPFATFSGMQIRPDNLMTLVFTAALLFVIAALIKQSPWTWFFSGFFIGLSALISLKIAPSVGVLLSMLFVYCLIKKNIRHYGFCAVGTVVSAAVFCLFFFIQGSFFPMLQQVLADSGAMQSSLWNPPPFGFFYWPYNTVMYGLGGKPVTWYIAILLPVGALTGALYSSMRWRHSKIKLFFILVCIGMAGAQYLFLFTLRSFFVQYYLTVNWICALFAAVFIDAVTHSVKKYKAAAMILHLFLFFLFVLVSYYSVAANISRPKAYPAAYDEAIMRKRWAIVPSDAAVYPVLLFRPLSQPIPYGYFIPEVPPLIRNRYPGSLEALSHTSIRFLILTEYHMRFLDPETVSYIWAHFTRHPDDTDLWVRNTE
ncbi:MAG: hypothetical protein UV63_C0035G0016 [Microgenomates group bacterium GW2011_GWC1_43_11]|nr:MAG: hypothetical protein UV63_C0035G0016 [Microgenomates group bacterium GW2011_GWC1_43_11]HCM82105.1 hypothetical protein [Patescibacteria group bacterium]